MALIVGKAPSSVKVRGSKKGTVSEWPVINGDFRALVELSKGTNKIEFEAGSHKKKITLTYEPRSTRLRVTPVYVICTGHDGYFQV